MGRIATLWPAGMRSTVVTPSATNRPAGRLERAISTPSSGCRRMTGAGVMGVSLMLRKYRAPDAAQRERCAADPGPSGASQWIPDLRFIVEEALHRVRDTKASRLAARLFPGLRNLHPRIGRHQANLVKQGHHPKTHVDRAQRAVGARA